MITMHLNGNGSVTAMNMPIWIQGQE